MACLNEAWWTENGALALGVCLVLSGCGAQSTPLIDEAAVPETVRIDVQVDLGTSDAADVRVTGRCGQRELTAVTGLDGRYTLDIDMIDCDRIVLQHEKTGFLPAFRVVPVSPSQREVSLTLELEPLNELECGSELCHTKYGTDVMTGGVIARGYQYGEAGDVALDQIPPDMRTDDDELISFLGFQYLEVYDADGNRLDETEIVRGCTRINQSGLSWVGDADPSTAEVDLDWYRYDEHSGRWKRGSTTGELLFRRGNRLILDDGGHCDEVMDDSGRAIRDLQPVERSMMPDVRAEEHYAVPGCASSAEPEPIHVREYWVCGPVEGMGFYAYGRSAPEQTCYAMRVTNECDEPLEGVLFSARGVEHGYLHHASTGPDGTACIDVMASEPIGEDYDLDELGGEVFSVELEVRGGRAGRERIENKENPKDFGSCEEPETCVQLSQQLNGCSR
jgi:hypothetical protein